MATKKRTPPAAKSETTDPQQMAGRARLSVGPNANAAAIIEQFGKPFGEQNIRAIQNELVATFKDVHDGDLKRCESMLMGQAQALQSMFMNFSRRALVQEYQSNLESFFRMALKAQNQCRMTLETLATIKNPPIVYAKQANIANGPQQVNNGVLPPAHTEKVLNQSNELLEAKHGERLDTGTASASGGVDKELATVGKIDRATNG